MENAREILKKLRRLELRTRGKVEASFTGQYRSGDVRHIVADPARAERVLGFRAVIDPADGLTEFATAPLRGLPS